MTDIKRNQLNQIYYLNKEFVMWQEKLNRLQSKRDATKSLTDIEPTGVHSGHTTDAVGNLATDIVEVQEIITGILAQIQHQRRETMRHISSVDDSLLRQILQLRCVDCMRWEDVGASLGIPGDAAKKIFYRAYPD